MSVPFIAIANGHQLFVSDWGEGPPVVLLAPWAMDSHLWADVMTRLNAGDLRTVAYDRRGHGRSTDPGRFDHDLLAVDLAAVLDGLDLTGMTLVAHSSAAREAIRYATRHGTGRIARLVLVAPIGPRMLAGEDNPDGVPREAIEAVLDQLAHDLPGWIDADAELFAPGASRRTLDWLGAMMLDTSRRLALDLQRLIAEVDLTAGAAALALPVTVVHGDRDVSAPLDLTGRRYAAIIPASRLIVYEGVAHAIMVTHAGRLADEILREVRDVEG